MARILVAGLVNLETTLAVDGFPIPYEPVRYPFFGVGATVSGVGFNVAKALSRLGHDVVFASLLADNAAGREARRELARLGIDDRYVYDDLAATPLSVILYEPSGRRMIHVDLKDIQDRRYPADRAQAALKGVDLAVVCNINFARTFLSGARSEGICIATDVHALASLDDDYNREWLESASILFASHEKIACEPGDWLKALMERFGPSLVVLGMGASGALLAERDGSGCHAVAARSPRPVVSTIGAGDALFSCFLDGWIAGMEPRRALERAALFAGWKVGEKGAAEGLLTREELDRLLDDDNAHER